ncbi:MAG: TonB family protein [Bacteroidota bacterium]
MNESFQHDDARFTDLLQRWSTGDFTRADEQELYALARSDEHRREALEGFLAVPDQDHHVRIDAMRQKLQEQTGSKRRILPISVIMSVAAGIVLLLIAVFTIPKLLLTSDRAPVAFESKPVLVKPDSMVTQTDQGLSSTQAPAATQPAIRSELDKKSSNGPALDKMPENNNTLAQNKALRQKTPAMRKEKVQHEDIALAPARAQAQAVNAEPAPSIPANDDALAMKKTAASESAGTAPGAAPQIEAANNAKIPSDKMKAKSSDLDPKLSIESYLTQKARLPKVAHDNNISGSVAVQFTIDENGKATNLQVIRGLGFGCDEEALRLIRLFTFEKKAAGQTLTVLAPFVR